MKKRKKIAILTGGGDCPGINAVIRAVAKTAIREKNMEVIGILDGYQGVIHNQYKPLRIIEVMGHRAGWVALYSGVAGGGDIILIPEKPYDLRIIADKVKERNQEGKKFSIVVAAEGAKPTGGEIVIQRMVEESSDPIRLGGIGFVLGDQIEKATGLETRTVVMGHLLRGGSPTAFDRILGTRLGVEAVNLIDQEKFGVMVGMKGNSTVTASLKEVAKGPRTVPLNHPMIKAARAVGTCFGD